MSAYREREDPDGTRHYSAYRLGGGRFHFSLTRAERREANLALLAMYAVLGAGAVVGHLLVGGWTGVLLGLATVLAGSTLVGTVVWLVQGVRAERRHRGTRDGRS